MMFVGFRMRVLQLTGGKGAPQEYVRRAGAAPGLCGRSDTAL